MAEVDHADGRDWPPALVHQAADGGGDTYWAQITNAITAREPSVTINDTAPSTDPYNLGVHAWGNTRAARGARGAWYERAVRSGG